MMKKCLELSNMDSLIVGNTYLEVRMRKHNGKKIIGAILLLVILVLVGNGKMQQAKADPLQPEIARKILRFHILANSDSEEDQAVKIKVRDAIGKMMGPKLADSKNLEETKKIVSENMNDIVALAEKTLEDNGYTCSRRTCPCTVPGKKLWGLYISGRRIRGIGSDTWKRWWT